MTGIFIIFIISLILGIAIVNSIYNLIMRIVGANIMFFSVKAKIFWYFLVVMTIMGILCSIFGITAPGDKENSVITAKTKYMPERNSETMSRTSDGDKNLFENEISEDTKPEETPIVNGTMESLDSEKEELVDTVTDNYIGNDLTFTGWSAFENGRAWVQYGLSQTTTALIDTNGKILWETNAVVEDVSEIRDGFAYCRLAGTEYDTYVIFDTDGNITFTKECDENYLILEHGNGVFLAAEHIMNFDTNEWRIGAIDKEGNTVSPFKTYETTVPLGVEATEYKPRIISFDDFSLNSYQCEYRGDTIFELSLIYSSILKVEILLDIEKQSVIYSYDGYNVTAK